MLDNSALRVEVDGLYAAMVEMRRAAINFFDASGHRCDGDDCNRFATWRKTERDYPMNACDHCVDDMRESDRRVVSKGGHPRGRWEECDGAAFVRELSKASTAVGKLIEEGGDQ